MLVGIVCGVSSSATKKAKIYAESISNAGHTPIIFSRSYSSEFTNFQFVIESDISRLYDAALRKECLLYLTCNDSLNSVVSRLNQSVNWPTIAPDSHYKDRLHLLTKELETPITVPWDHVDEINPSCQIFIKPKSGSGTSGSHPWAYKKFANTKEFKDYLASNRLIGAWEHSNRFPGTLGEYVIQEYIDCDTYEYIQCLNDGIAKPWFVATVKPKKEDFLVSVELDFSANHFGLLDTVLPGTFAGFQYFKLPSRNILFDFNTRYGSHWTYLYSHVFPEFFDVFFNNLLNNHQEPYLPKYDKFKIILNSTGIKSSENSIFVFAEDFPFGGESAVSEIIME